MRSCLFWKDVLRVKLCSSMCQSLTDRTRLSTSAFLCATEQSTAKARLVHPQASEQKDTRNQPLKDDDLAPPLRAHPYRRFIAPWKSKEELAEHLLKNIIHNSDGVIAFNKPYGVGITNVQEMRQFEAELAEQQGKTVWYEPKGVKEAAPPAMKTLYHARGVTLSPYTLLDVLPILKSELRLPSLTFSKSTEKFTSGVAVFCENEKLTEKLKYLYKGAKGSNVKHTSYLVVTTLAPDPDNDKIKEKVGISIQNVELKGERLSLPIIERNFSTKRMKSRDVLPVQAEVNILSYNEHLNTALAEIQSTVTKHHFLRIYANDLMMPILGDHLFSGRIQAMLCVPISVNPLSVEPGVSTQVVPTKLLRSLSLKRAEDAIIIPFHAHQLRYTVPHFYRKWKHLVITAPPPNYFQWTCSQLKLELQNVLDSSNQKMQKE